MSQKNSYKTVEHESESLLIEKKSKFIANVKPVGSESEAVEFLNKIRSKYPDATHNVYAYIIDENNIFRYSDDGEPSGTAGMPVLDAIRKAELVDVIVVVTRYFGGTLLGTGGLVHTYGASAKEGLKASGIVTRTMCDVISVKADYTLSGRIQHKIASEGIRLSDIAYSSDVEFTVCSPINETDRLINEFTDLTNGKCECKIVDRKYISLSA